MTIADCDMPPVDRAPNAKIVELPGANLHLFLSNEADIIRELPGFASSLPAESGSDK